MIKRVRYKLIKKKVCEVFLSNNINRLPTNINRIYSNHKNCRIIPYSKFMKDHKLSEDEVISYLGSEDGCTILEESTNRYLVFINDLEHIIFSPRRRRWTLAHELGHIVLDHHRITDKTKLSRDGLSDSEYELLEKEANYFASILLAPSIVLLTIDVQSANDIYDLCELSMEASNNRFDNYLKWKRSNRIESYTNTILEQFHDFIYQKRCLNCGYGFIQKNAIYCPICGEILYWGEGKVIYKKGIPLDEKGKATICPRCENEEINVHDQYCKICGAFLYQKCGGIVDHDMYGNEFIVEEGCDILLDSNARYCTQCGRETTFYRYKYLKSWEEEYKENEVKKSMQESAPAIEPLYIKVDDDDGLPF